MFNIHTKEYETPETTKATIGTTYLLNRMSGPSTHYGNGKKRSDNAGVQDFGMLMPCSTSNVKLMTSERRLKARNCTTEFTLSGHNLGIHNGLQILLIKSTSETREMNQYSSQGNANIVPGSHFTENCVQIFLLSSDTIYSPLTLTLCHIVERQVGEEVIWYIQRIPKTRQLSGALTTI